jgi:L-amino acid N-acyltransferase YncA
MMRLVQLAQPDIASFPSSDTPGYGYVDSSTPELSIALAGEHREKGIGGLSLETLLVRAREAGVTTLSLSVAEANRALHLYERHGFRKLGRQDGSRTMRVGLYA